MSDDEDIFDPALTNQTLAEQVVALGSFERAVEELLQEIDIYFLGYFGA